MSDYTIYFCGCPYEDGKTITQSDDPNLVLAIKEYGEKLKIDGVEVFKQENNMIVTEQECVFAFYEKDLKKE